MYCTVSVTLLFPVIDAFIQECGVRPKYGNHPYCGKTCAQAAKRSSALHAVQPLSQTRQRTSTTSPPGIPARWSIAGASSAVGSAVGKLLWGRPHTALNTSQRSSTQGRHRILFYHRTDPYYGFTNFSPHPVKYDGKEYPTAEHLLQAFKVRRLFLLLVSFFGLS